jgi:hypothetical protein
VKKLGNPVHERFISWESIPSWEIPVVVITDTVSVKIIAICDKNSLRDYVGTYGSRCDKEFYLVSVDELINEDREFEDFLRTENFSGKFRSKW